MAVEATGTEQSLVENIDAVGCRQHHYSMTGVKAIHLHQQLVQGLIALFAAHGLHCTLASHCIYLINKDDRWSCLASLVEQVTHAAGAHADKHLYELGGADTKERYASLTGHRARQQRFSGARRAYQRHPQMSWAEPAASAMQLSQRKKRV